MGTLSLKTTVLLWPRQWSHMHTALWKLEPVSDSSTAFKIVNCITKNSQNPTYMKLGRATCTSPETYALSMLVSWKKYYTYMSTIHMYNTIVLRNRHTWVHVCIHSNGPVMQGCGQSFYFEPKPQSKIDFNIYAHTTEGDPKSPKAYLKPQVSGCGECEIVAVVVLRSPRDYPFSIYQH